VDSGLTSRRSLWKIIEHIYSSSKACMSLRTQSNGLIACVPSAKCKGLGLRGVEGVSQGPLALGPYRTSACSCSFGANSAVGSVYRTQICKGSKGSESNARPLLAWGTGGREMERAQQVVGISLDFACNSIMLLIDGMVMKENLGGRVNGINRDVEKEDVRGGRRNG
jgi:hypothetical protein